jgi:tRNA pseudouridine38-40 synthase
MARYQLILGYDGTQFAGSQKQANSRTVQGELERILRSLGWSGRSVSLAGRTDTGVHASGQVAAFDLEWLHSKAELQSAINAKLPPDLAVKDILEVSPGFHPRFEAHSRRYVYRLFCQPVRDPLRERFAWRVWPEVAGEKLIEAAKLFPGAHDFSSFGSPTTLKGSTKRTVMKSEWKNREDEWQFEVQADAFLYRMVRRMVFVQVAFAQGKCSLEQIREALHRQTKLPTGMAPAHGLRLDEVIL